MNVSAAIQKARDLLVQTRKPHTVYSRNGRIGVIPLQTYLDAELDIKGAKRITTVTMNGKGKII